MKCNFYDRSILTGAIPSMEYGMGLSVKSIGSWLIVIPKCDLRFGVGGRPSTPAEVAAVAGRRAPKRDQYGPSLPEWSRRRPKRGGDTRSCAAHDKCQCNSAAKTPGFAKNRGNWRKVYAYSIYGGFCVVCVVRRSVPVVLRDCGCWNSVLKVSTYRLKEFVKRGLSSVLVDFN